MYDHLYHKNAIKNREAIAARAQKRPRLTHTDQPIIPQIVGDSHPERTSRQMDIEPIYRPNTNDGLFPAESKPGQVEARGMAVVIAMTSSADTPDRTHLTSSAPETSIATNLQAVIPSRVSPSNKTSKRKEGSGSKLSKALSSMSLQPLNNFNNLSYMNGQDFDSGFQEFLDAISAASAEPLSNAQITTKKNEFRRMNRLLATLLIDVERSEFSRIAAKDVLNCIFSTYISLVILR